MPDPQLGKAKASDVVAALTLQEKVKLLRGTGMNLPSPDAGDGPTVGVAIDERVPGAAGNTHAIERLGIPSIVMADGPAGVRIAPKRKGVDERRFHATAFPIATLIATTWDVDAAYAVGRAMGAEARAYGVDVLLAPALNLQRFALGGRNFEYYSEDPLLSGSMAAAAVRGVQSQGVGTSIKHYVANNHEWNRDTIDVRVDERTLRELYLRGFEIAVKEGAPWTVMSSYNRVNGEYVSESAWLLSTILRDEWGFDGLVMTDWFGGRDPAAQMEAGNDLLMPGTQPQEAAILAAVASGELDERVLDRNVAHLLELVGKTLSFTRVDYNDAPDLQASAAVARQVAADGMVLLANNATLPLAASARVALFGSYAYQTVIGGTGSGDVNEAYSVDIDEGLANAGFKLDETVAAAYRAHLEAFNSTREKPQGIEAFMPQPALPELDMDQAQIERAAATADVAVLTIGRASGEFLDRQASDFSLSEPETDLLEAVSSVFAAAGKRLVVLLNVAGPVETRKLDDLADAVLVVWQPGQECGNAVADILTGHVNPSGKLAATFALELADHPQAGAFPGTELDPKAEPSGLMRSVPAAVEYDEALNVGYRYFVSCNRAVAFAFGHGLSYTTFDLVDLSVVNQPQFVTVNATIENTGDVAGREVVQIYVTAPQAALAKPQRELRAFAKTTLLEPGARETFAFELGPRDLASFDAERGRWVVAAGHYEVLVGASVVDIRASAQFTLRETLIFDP